MEESKIPKERLEVLKKIEEYEKLGGEYLFYDVENDPIPKMLMPKDVDYTKKKLSSKFKNVICRIIVNKWLRGYSKKHQFKVNGIENLKNLKSGAIITTNHFHYFDASPLVYALKKYKVKKKIHIVIREGNYQMGGLFGFILKNYNTFPLSSNLKTTINLNKAIDRAVSKKELVLVYPEQSMWWKYKKPRAYRVGAFRWAVRNNVPIIPCFTTMEDMDYLEEDGMPAQKLTLNIGSPIYPDENLGVKERAEDMMRKNHEINIKIYENFYNMKYDL